MKSTILVVDDDPVAADHYGRILRLNGYEVLTAFNAYAAMDLAAELPPDLVVLDLRMPELDGADLLDRLHVGGLANVPAIIVTGDYLLDDDTRARLEGSGAQLLFKPLWVDDLVWAVNAALARPHRAGRDAGGEHVTQPAA